MSYHLFKRRGKGDGEHPEFAATVLSMPPDESLPPGAVDAAAPAAGAASAPAPAAAGPPRGTALRVAADPGPASEPAAAESNVEQRPTISHIGRYALKGLLGEGGLGQVHEAWDPLLSRTVAVKTLQFDIDAPTRLALDKLFLNEARAVAGLSHPNIVTVHDAGLSAHGVYIAMERLRGCDLRRRLADGWQPSPAQAAHLIRRVADGLAYAHARGVVHCDIKPGNIFLTRGDKPKVLDFGIARVAHDSALQSGWAALDGAIVGSPHYLAPEQLQGGTPDARTDIHALGVVFHELLTRRKAFGGNSVAQITESVLGARPAPAHESCPGVPRKLSLLAAKAMARDPADRYASAGEMAAELRRWLDQHGDGAGVAGVVAWFGLRRGRRIALIAAAVALCGAAVVALTLRPRRPPPPLPAAPPLPPAAPAPAQVPVQADAAPPAAAAPPPAAAAEPAQTPAAATERTAAPRHGAAPRARAQPRGAHPLQAAPAPMATGSLQLAITPWGQVEIDGVTTGTTPPLTRLTLSAGRHTVTVRNEDFAPYTAVVQVEADKPVTVRYRFGK